MQRFSEYHYRVKEGSFTNCDAQEGEVPAWRIRADDLDLRIGDTVAFKGIVGTSLRSKLVEAEGKRRS